MAGGARLKAAMRRSVAAVRRYAVEVWGRDRAALVGWPALRTRVARIVTWTVRGVVVNKLNLRAAALAYYTMFSIVPVLVVALWVLKLTHAIPNVAPALSNAADGAASGAPALSAPNALLRQAARAILAAVDRAGQLETGLVGLAALLYGVIRQLLHVGAAMKIIAGVSAHRPRYSRLLGYLALLALPPALVIVSGVVRVLSRLPLGSKVAGAISWLLTAVPLLKSAASTLIGLAILGLALAIFYASSARARLALSSAVVGATLSALLLVGVLWAFARLQIGVSRAGALQSGMAAIPVFLLWASSSWLAVLIGAQVAVAHELDGILIHGARAWQLEPFEQQVAGVQMVVAVARRAPAASGRGVAINDLARRLRLPPPAVREVAGRLAHAGLLREVSAGEYRLACDPARTTVRQVAGAVIGRPTARAAVERATPRSGRTLRDLTDGVEARVSK